MSRTLNRYEIEEDLGSSGSFRLVRARPTAGGPRVLLKMPRDSGRDRTAVDALRRECRIARELELPWIVPVRELVESSGEAALVLDDHGGQTLDRTLRAGSLELTVALSVAGQLAVILQTVHEAGYVHGDVRPCNILVLPGGSQVELMGLSTASAVPRYRAFAPLDGELSYVSPEQTGRTDRLIDYRTDFYSLGVTLFEMLTGWLPFEADDPLELVQAHVTKEPPKPSRISAGIPLAVSEIVLKLLSKDAEGRYQSGQGLRADLERCLRDLHSTGECFPFDLGERDEPTRFELPQHLYGRGAEIGRLEAELDAVCQGETRVMLLQGPTGIGKTALAESLRSPVLRRRGYFVTGKYDRFRPGAPCSAILEALSDVVARLSAREGERRTTLTERVRAALGPNLGVLADVIPGWTELVGEAPRPRPLDPGEARHRLHICVRRFLRAVATREHPVVLFLDDLQWMDDSSLDLLRGAVGPGLGSLLLVGALRGDSGEEPSGLRETLAEIRSTGIELDELRLGPLCRDDVHRLVTDAMRGDDEELSELADLVYAASGGVPLEAGWALVSHQRGDSSCSGDAMSPYGGLPAEVRGTLSLAAALGDPIDVAVVAELCDLPPARAEGHLITACEARVLELGAGGFRFAHDSVREEACTELPAESHERIADLLEQNGADEFAIVDHLDRAGAPPSDPDRRRRAARLHLAAGNRAKELAALPTAFRHFARGIELLPTNSWEDCPELAARLHAEAAEAACLIADFATAERMVDALMTHGHSVLDGLGIESDEAIGTATSTIASRAAVLENVRLHADLERECRKRQRLEKELRAARDEIAALGTRTERSTRRDLGAVERKHIIEVLEECGWKISGERNAARRLGLHPNTLRSRMKKLKIVRPK